MLTVPSCRRAVVPSMRVAGTLAAITTLLPVGCALLFGVADADILAKTGAIS